MENLVLLNYPGFELNRWACRDHPVTLPEVYPANDGPKSNTHHRSRGDLVQNSVTFEIAF